MLIFRKYIDNRAVQMVITAIIHIYVHVIQIFEEIGNGYSFCWDIFRL